MSNLIAFSTESFLVSDKVQVLTADKFMDNKDSAGADEAFITNYGASLRYLYDGSEPSPNMGHVLADGGTLRLRGKQQMVSFKFVAIDSLTELTVTYERR